MPVTLIAIKASKQLQYVRIAQKMLKTPAVTSKETTVLYWSDTESVS